MLSNYCKGKTPPCRTYRTCPPHKVLLMLPITIYPTNLFAFMHNNLKTLKNKTGENQTIVTKLILLPEINIE